MSEPQVLERLQKIVVDYLDYRGTLHLEHNLVEDLELDSIRLLTLAVEVESEFQVILSDDQDLITVGDLVAEVIRQHPANN